MVVEIKADVDNARAIANDMDSYGESVSESAGRCGQEAYSRDTAFGKEFMRSASAYTQLLQGTGANIGEAMSSFSQRVCSAAKIFEQAAPVVGKTKGKASDIHETSKKNESDEAFEPLLSLVDSVVNVLSIPPLPPKTL